jgi:hypothetical protein
MKIKELIAILEGFDQEAEIYVFEGRYASPVLSVHEADISGLFAESPEIQIVIDCYGEQRQSSVR